jgi:chemotaxis receptor (MCP) glutamine deamidase CheD
MNIAGNPVLKEAINGNLWVPPGHVKTGQETDVLFTSEVGACIEVAIYDPALKIGHMAHIFSTYGSQYESFKKLKTNWTDTVLTLIKLWVG